MNRLLTTKGTRRRRYGPYSLKDGTIWFKRRYGTILKMARYCIENGTVKKLLYDWYCNYFLIYRDLKNVSTTYGTCHKFLTEFRRNPRKSVAEFLECPLGKPRQDCGKPRHDFGKPRHDFGNLRHAFGT